MRPSPKSVVNGVYSQQCSKCKNWLPLTEENFYRRTEVKHCYRLRTICKTCEGKGKTVARRKWRLIPENREKERALCRRYITPKRYGLSLESYTALINNAVCAICGKTREEVSRTLHVDHNHRCCGTARACEKCRRGVLCTDCNRGLGCFDDNIDVIIKAVKYLQRWEKIQMNIGEPLREIYIEPLEMPEPLREMPAAEPVKEPEEVPEKV